MSTHLGQQTGPNIPEGIVFYPGVSEGVKEARVLSPNYNQAASPAQHLVGFKVLTWPGSDPEWLGSGHHCLCAPVVHHLPLDFIILQFSKIDGPLSNSQHCTFVLH